MSFLVCVLGVLACAPGLFAQTLMAIPSCGKAGETRVCLTGTGWAEPNPVCRYLFYFDGVTVAPDQPDGLFGPPKTSFIVPAGAAPGDHVIRCELRLDSNDQLLQVKEIPFKVVTNIAAATATAVANGPAIDITFNPGDSCDTCKKIVIIQTVRRFAIKDNVAMEEVITTVTDWPNFPDADKKLRDETATTKRRVDRIWGKTYPYYGVDNTGVPDVGMASSLNNMTTGGTGMPPTPATLYDRPNTPGAAFPTNLMAMGIMAKKAILRFEAAPFCAEGPDAGRYLGKVILWEHHQDKGAAAGVVQNVTISDGQPSADHTAAVNKWVGGNPPDRAAFNLPKPDANLCPP